MGRERPRIASVSSYVANGLGEHFGDALNPHCP
jgi:hypothetical protein